MIKDENNDAEMRLQILLHRRSIRKYSDKKVSEESLRRIIEYATWAPSACNKQDWRFIIIKDEMVKNKISEAGGSVLIPHSPIGILVTYRKSVRNVYYHDDIQSASACIQNLLLATEAFGLGACWLCNLPSKRFLRKLFKIPRSFSPIAYVILGHPDKKVTNIPRKFGSKEITGINTFPTKPEDYQSKTIKSIITKILVTVYRISPTIIKKRFLNRLIDKHFVKRFEN